MFDNVGGSMSTLFYIDEIATIMTSQISSLKQYALLTFLKLLKLRPGHYLRFLYTLDEIIDILRLVAGVFTI